MAQKTVSFMSIAGLQPTSSSFTLAKPFNMASLKNAKPLDVSHFKAIKPIYNLAPRKNRIGNEPKNSWILTGQSVPKNFLNNLERTNKILGSKSSFGTVSPLLYKGTNNSSYVIKKIPFLNNNIKNSHIRRIFNKEIGVGSIRGINNVGPRILAFTRRPTYLEYIMNHAKHGNPNAVITPITQAKKIDVKLWSKIIKKVRNFQRITGGEHGNIHGNNILLVTIPGNPKTFIKIIDYGSHRSHEELKNKIKESKKHFGMNLFSFKTGGQKFIHNNNALKTMIRKSIKLKRE